MIIALSWVLFEDPTKQTSMLYDIQSRCVVLTYSKFDLDILKL